MSDIFTQIKSIGVVSIARHHGLEVSEDERAFSPCPSCGAKTRHTKRNDPRPACVVIHAGSGWQCIQCDSKGDTVDLLARLLNKGKRPADAASWRAVLARWTQGGATLVLPRLQTPLETPLMRPQGHPVRPPYPEVMALWNRSTVFPSKRSLSWLAKKFPKYTVNQIAETGVARFMVSNKDYEWWPWRYDYLAMLLFDHRGLVQSIHGRKTMDVEDGRPKSSFPKGYSASGLVMANKTGASWLRGKIPVDEVIIAEGLTSTLAATMAMRATGKWRTAIFGYVSGSNDCIKQMPWMNQHVYILTDADKTGDLYAEKIMKVLPGNVNLRRGIL